MVFVCICLRVMVCVFACLFDCCLFVVWFVCLFACLFGRMFVCIRLRVMVCMFGCLLDCCLFVLWFVCEPLCLDQAGLGINLFRLFVGLFVVLYSNIRYNEISSHSSAGWFSMMFCLGFSHLFVWLFVCLMSRSARYGVEGKPRQWARNVATNGSDDGSDDGLFVCLYSLFWG